MQKCPEIYSWNISVYLVINFMHNWNGKRLPLISMNGDTLRNQFLIDLLKFKGNEAKDNIPQDIQEVMFVILLYGCVCVINQHNNYVLCV